MKRRGMGFALLLEVIVGLGIFATAMLMIFGLFASSQKATVSSKNLAVATDLAKEIMEAEITKGSSAKTWTDPVDVPMPTTVDGVETTTHYSTMVNVDPINPDTYSFKRQILKVTVSWDEVTGLKRSTQLETIIVD